MGVNQSIDGNDPSTITQHNDNRTNLSSRNSKEQNGKTIHIIEIFNSQI